MSQMESIVKNQGLLNCLDKIEKMLGWGKSSEWSSYDFEKLSENIYRETGMKLSVNTLKRIWGRLSYEPDPSTTTLNILAQFLGYEDWRHFVTQNENRKKTANRIGIKKYYFIAIPFLLLSLIYLVFHGNSFFIKSPNPSDFSFSSKRISENIPNSVVFQYSTPTYIKEDDKLEIQQSWDESKRQTISSLDSIATSIYYTPGYFVAKLVANDAVVQEHGLLIPSNGWLGIVEGEKGSIYLDENDIATDGSIAISDSISKLRWDKNNQAEETAKLYYIKDFDNLYLDDFIIDMVVRNDIIDPRKVCQSSNITVYCEGQVIIVPLSPKGCVSEINLRILDPPPPPRFISGKTNDLSNFGVDILDDVAVRMISSDGRLSIFVNDLLAYSAELQADKNRSISGIRYEFQGSGSIERFVIRNNKKVFLSRPSS